MSSMASVCKITSIFIISMSCFVFCHFYIICSFFLLYPILTILHFLRQYLSSFLIYLSKTKLTFRICLHYIQTFLYNFLNIIITCSPFCINFNTKCSLNHTWFSTPISYIFIFADLRLEAPCWHLLTPLLSFNCSLTSFAGLPIKYVFTNLSSTDAS